MVQVSYMPWGRSLRYYTPRAFGTQCINRVATSPSSYNLYIAIADHEVMDNHIMNNIHSDVGHRFAALNGIWTYDSQLSRAMFNQLRDQSSTSCWVQIHIYMLQCTAN